MVPAAVKLDIREKCGYWETLIRLYEHGAHRGSSACCCLSCEGMDIVLAKRTCAAVGVTAFLTCLLLRSAR